MRRQAEDGGRGSIKTFISVPPLARRVVDPRAFRPRSIEAARLTSARWIPAERLETARTAGDKIASAERHSHPEARGARFGRAFRAANRIERERVRWVQVATGHLARQEKKRYLSEKTRFPAAH